jgi:hypothetical protein
VYAQSTLYTRRAAVHGCEASFQPHDRLRSPFVVVGLCACVCLADSADPTIKGVGGGFLSIMKALVSDGNSRRHKDTPYSNQNSVHQRQHQHWKSTLTDDQNYFLTPTCYGPHGVPTSRSLSPTKAKIYESSVSELPHLSFQNLAARYPHHQRFQRQFLH